MGEIYTTSYTRKHYSGSTGIWWNVISFVAEGWLPLELTAKLEYTPDQTLMPFFDQRMITHTLLVRSQVYST